MKKFNKNRFNITSDLREINLVNTRGRFAYSEYTATGKFVIKRLETNFTYLILSLVYQILQLSLQFWYLKISDKKSVAFKSKNFSSTLLNMKIFCTYSRVL